MQLVFVKLLLTFGSLPFIIGRYLLSSWLFRGHEILGEDPISHLLHFLKSAGGSTELCCRILHGAESILRLKCNPLACWFLSKLLAYYYCILVCIYFYMEPSWEYVWYATCICLNCMWHIVSNVIYFVIVLVIGLWCKQHPDSLGGRWSKICTVSYLVWAVALWNI